MLAAALLLAGCGQGETEQTASAGNGGGAALERAALASGLVERDEDVEPIGAFGTVGDRACLLPLPNGDRRIGVSTDYGEDQRCTAIGTARGSGRLDVRLGDDCRFTAQVDADRLTFPASLPAGCSRFCTGRASLAALTADRLSGSAAEAARMQAPDGQFLCPG